VPSGRPKPVQPPSSHCARPRESICRLDALIPEVAEANQRSTMLPVVTGDPVS